MIGEDGSARKSEAVSPIPRDFDVFIMGIDLVTTPETEERGLELLNTQFAAIAGLLPGRTRLRCMIMLALKRRNIISISISS